MIALNLLADKVVSSEDVINNLVRHEDRKNEKLCDKVLRDVLNLEEDLYKKFSEFQVNRKMMRSLKIVYGDQDKSCISRDEIVDKSTI